ncbi:MAG: class I tRNA ligase family protein [Candidatus Paceibacterota bacterium]|jgi:leucyl-tRNA synthetase
MKGYDHRKIEKKWQDKWLREKIYLTDEGDKKPKSFVLDMFPYPSGEGLHVGHVRVYTASDVYSRMKRMRGYRVLHPTGWDAFGLPTENYAIKNKMPPQKVTKENTDTFRRQMKLLGLSYDWEREINTTDPSFYKWTQWIFLQLLKKGLAYESYEPILWCPSCKTGLANEDLDGNECERCGTVVEKRPMRQWVLKITDYADRLIDDLDLLSEWPLAFREAQRNWIGRSEGAVIKFPISNSQFPIEVFTTRPDTLFGATYMVLAPDHNLVSGLKDKITNWNEVEKYVVSAGKKTEIERTAEGKDKTGIELKGIKAINPANKEEVPVFIADYVLKEYGTGAIMAVPAHDERDYEFAKKFNLPIVKVIEPSFTQTTDPGKVVEGLPVEDREAIIAIVKHWSEDKYIALKWKSVAWVTFITGGIEEGQTAEEAAKMEIMEETGYLNPELTDDFGTLHGKFYHVPKKVNRFAHASTLVFKLKNSERKEVSEDESKMHEVIWLNKDELAKFLTPDSHQRALEILNGKEMYAGSGLLINSGQFNGMESPEAKKEITEFIGGQMKTAYKLRDWVFSRQRYWGEPIPVVHCEKDGVVPVPEAELPILLPEVKFYEPTGTGESPLAGIEAWVNTTCPKCGSPAKRETNTMPQWAGSSWYYLRFIDPQNNKTLIDPKKEKDWMPVDVYVGGAEHATRHLIYARFWHKFLKDIDIVSTDEPFTRLESVGLILGEGGIKMSKRLGNVVNPDDIILTYGADTLRLYEMFIGPFSQASVWNMKSIIGPRRFLEKVWRVAEKIGDGELSDETAVLLNQTIKKVGEDIEVFKFNTAISQMMILLSSFESDKIVTKESFESFLKILSLFAPHITEELWEDLGHTSSIHSEPWPKYDESKLAGDTCTIVIQINGKVRGSFVVPVGSDDEAVKKEGLGHESVQKWLGGVDPKKVVYVKGKLVSIVT